MDQSIRNKLRNVVTQCRKLLEDAVAQVLQGQFGIYATGKKDAVHVDDDVKMKHLSDEDRAYRKDILDHLEHVKALGYKPMDSLAQLVREIAFTHLNRFCAYKMMEARSLIRESVSKGVKSQGFLFYLADHEDDEKRANSGQQDVAYRHFLNWLGGTLSEEIGVLFNPHDSANRLYPPQRVLDDVLNLLNDEALADIWTQDETIGWVYQYFTPKELRDQVRKESQAPRNSYELAFRNQFFTPRYVVEFLTDNTLGRIWYEMRKGDTKLKDQSRYMVRRPTELFLKDGKQPPKDAAEGRDDLSQEELLKLPVHVPHRPKKDPRELKILDPACGSGHFLLYCFDLLFTIYEEAYGDPELGPTLKQDYATLDDLKRDVPRLILAHNLHGIDIDLRASQIAALALWLRCQRAYQEMGLKKDRPKINRSNFACAEPMPGEPAMLKEFVGQVEPRLLGQLVEVVFDKMKLAGEAGSLLKIEEEIRTVVASAKQQWEAGPVEVQRTLFDRSEPKHKQKRFNLSGVTDDEFFNEAEGKVVEALRDYAEKATNGQRLQRRLFTEDAVRGFAFVDLCHKRFDVVLMNPPFGDPSGNSNAYLQSNYTAAKHDVSSAFVERARSLCAARGLVGSITPRTLFFLSYLSEWRETAFIKGSSLLVFADFGDGVLDATIETAAHVIGEKHPADDMSAFLRVLDNADRSNVLQSVVHCSTTGTQCESLFLSSIDTFSQISGSPFAYTVSDRIRRLFGRPSFETKGRKGFVGALTQDDFRFLRLWWETDPYFSGRGWTSGTRAIWVPFTKGGSYTPYFADFPLTIKWDNDGEELKEFLTAYRRERGFADQWTSQLNAYDKYFSTGITWSCRPNPQGSFWILPSGCIFGNSSPAIIASEDALLWLMGVMNSRIYRAMLDLLMPRGATSGQSLKYNLGYLRSVPVPTHSDQEVTEVASLVRDCVKDLRTLDESDECSHFFHGQAHAAVHGVRNQLHSTWMEIKHRRAETIVRVNDRTDHIENIVERGYAIPVADLSELYANTAARRPSENGAFNPLFHESSECEWVAGVVSWLVGCSFGRWNVCHEKTSSTSDIFSPFPVSPPAALSRDTVESPPSVIGDGRSWGALNGILADDPDQADDIIERVRGVLEVIWKDASDNIEKEACEIFGVKELRDYFRKPGKGGFWDDHVSRYSKSRRKAPIYWLLQSSKKNYGIWLYYHRLDKDLLFKALVNYVEPKIRLEASHLDSLRSQKSATGDSGTAAKKIDKEIEKQEDLISELQDFEDKLRRAANLHLEPDLNDGVVLNIAPLHELVPWKEAKSYWNELLEGKYEWSSIGKQIRERGLVK